MQFIIFYPDTTELFIVWRPQSSGRACAFLHFNTGHRIWHAEKDNVALFGRGGGIGMKNMIYTTVRKPSFMVKMALITVLFIAALIEQVSNTGLYANSFGTQEHMTVILLLIHTFSYSDFYQNIFFIGFIFLIPDIVKEEYIERSSIMKYSSRNTAGKRAIEKIIFSPFCIWPGLR